MEKVLYFMHMMSPENNGEWKFLSGEFDKRSKREKAKSNKNVLLDNHQKKWLKHIFELATLNQGVLFCIDN